MISAKVVGGENLRKKLTRMAGPESVDAMLKANLKNADEFERMVRMAIPKGDAERGHLVDTLKQQQTGPARVAVSIGGPEAPYPLHLEVGHKARDGSHVPGKPAWFPAKQVVKKRAHNRTVRAERAAIKKIAGG